MSYAANPRAPADNTPIEEGTGIVTSDSLAAESLKSGGSFAEGDATASAVPSKSTTANTTETSGATILPAVADGTERPLGISDYSENDATGSTSAALAGPGGTSDGSYDTSKGGPQAADGGAAPSYVAAVTREGQNAADLKPKGKNITEGGFDADAPNASFNADIGSRNDPGRLGEDDAFKASARSGADAGYPGASAGADAGRGKGGFEHLGDEAA